MNDILLDFLNEIATNKIEWELKMSFSVRYNQIKTAFENGWGVSIVFEDNKNISLETSYSEENFFVYHDFDSVDEVLKEVLKIKEY